MPELTDPGSVRRRVIVRGRVQGVWFRATCADVAVGRGVAGWVRNREEGAVEAVFEGLPEQVEGMVAWCRLGPPGAFVDSVEVVAEEPLGERGFRVAR